MEENYNIVIIEDDKDLCRRQKEYFDRKNIKVKFFRDLLSFEKAEFDKSLWNGLSIKHPTVFIIDIMLAEELDYKLTEAPRWNNPNIVPNGSEKNKYIDYELGLTIAKKLRSGYYKSIDEKSAILFCTARQNEALQREISSIPNSDFLAKPFWFDEQEDKIQLLLSD